MPITRAKASQLLNQNEMSLYDDSRINGLRQLDAKALASRVTRSRTARDRARDLVQRHKLASRERTGSKRGRSGVANQRSKDKAELLADILKRFETRLREVEREAKAAAKGNGKPAAQRAKAPTKRTTARAAARGKTATKKSSTNRTARRAGEDEAPRGSTTKRAGARKATSAKTSAGKPARKTARKRHITPEQALAQTRALLEAKQARELESRPWEATPGGEPAAGAPGYQSDGAARRAKRLHAAEARIPAIQGSISTRDRINQGKRDHRGDED